MKASTVRSLNRQIRLLTEPFAAAEGARTEFVCECAAETCLRAVSMTAAEWDAATRAPGYAVVSPQHAPRGEATIILTERYAVVRGEPGVAPESSEDVNMVGLDGESLTGLA